MSKQAGRQLEEYTLFRPEEVLLVSTVMDGEIDEVAIFKGFSSSLMRSTAFDLDVPVIPIEAEITNIDRLKAPYLPDRPHYIQRGLTWDNFQALLAESGVKT